MDSLQSAKDLFTQLTPLQIGVAAIAFIFLLIGLRLIFKKPPAHLTAFSGEAGNVLVSRKALQELVRSACLLDEWVEAARPVIRVRNNKVTALVELRLTKPDNLKAVCERVQEHITALLQKSLSFDQIGEIQIVVKSFSNEASELPDPAEPQAITSTLGSSTDVSPQITEPSKSEINEGEDKGTNTP